MPKITNWLAIAAYDYRKKLGYEHEASDAVEAKWRSQPAQERKDAFIDIFTTAHAGFSMAKAAAGTQPLHVHTGRLGCGVFKNSWPLSAAAQLLAARVVGVQSIKLYGVADQAQITRIDQIIARHLSSATASTKLEVVLNAVANEIADGTGDHNHII